MCMVKVQEARGLLIHLSCNNSSNAGGHIMVAKIFHQTKRTLQNIFCLHTIWQNIINLQTSWVQSTSLASFICMGCFETCVASAAACLKYKRFLAFVTRNTTAALSVHRSHILDGNLRLNHGQRQAQTFGFGHLRSSGFAALGSAQPFYY